MQGYILVRHPCMGHQSGWGNARVESHVLTPLGAGDGSKDALNPLGEMQVRQLPGGTTQPGARTPWAPSPRCARQPPRARPARTAAVGRGASSARSLDGVGTMTPGFGLEA